jgi:hypothetical protein
MTGFFLEALLVIPWIAGTRKTLYLVTPAFPFVIPAKAGIQEFDE